MKNVELQRCCNVMDTLLRPSEDGTITVRLTAEERSAFKKLLRIVTGLSQAAQEFSRKESTLSEEQRQYLANFNDVGAVPTAEVRRGEKLQTRVPMTAEQARVKLQSCVRKAVLANQFLKTARHSSTSLLEIEMSKLTSWETFNINTVSRLSQRRPLQIVGLACFQRYGLIEKFQIPDDTMHNFLAAVEDHYLPNPYHNSTHAADVTQNLICLLEADKISLKFTDLEIFAMLLSAVLHDVGHPGWNNAFLITTQDEQAIVYNDASVNENMSASLGFKILQYPECNIFCNMNRQDYFYVRKLVIDIILATDMAFHGGVVEQYITAMTAEDHDEWDSWKPSSRALVMKMLVHCADLGNPCKPPKQAGMWAQAVYDEFFRQGDAERDANLPVSALFDRNTVSIHASQFTFLEFVVTPCYKALGLICPKASKTGLYWIEKNSLLWRELAAKGLDHGIIGFDTEGNCELVHVAPRNTRTRQSSAWGNMELLTSLLLDKAGAHGDLTAAGRQHPGGWGGRDTSSQFSSSGTSHAAQGLHRPSDIDPISDPADVHRQKARIAMLKMMSSVAAQPEADGGASAPAPPGGDAGAAHTDHTNPAPDADGVPPTAKLSKMSVSFGDMSPDSPSDPQELAALLLLSPVALAHAVAAEQHDHTACVPPALPIVA